MFSDPQRAAAEKIGRLIENAGKDSPPDNVVTMKGNGASGWRVLDGNGIVLADGFPTNSAAWQWVDQHDTSPVKQRSPSSAV